MAEIVRLGDASNHGGHMSTASGNITVNGIQVCVEGDEHTCPIVGHGTTPVTTTQTTLASDGKAVLTTGNAVAGCGAIITQGSPNTTAY